MSCLFFFFQNYCEIWITIVCLIYFDCIIKNHSVGQQSNTHIAHYSLNNNNNPLLLFKLAYTISCHEFGKYADDSDEDRNGLAHTILFFFFLKMRNNQEALFDMIMIWHSSKFDWTIWLALNLRIIFGLEFFVKSKSGKEIQRTCEMFLWPEHSLFLLFSLCKI